jgi:hypothetical protein
MAQMPAAIFFPAPGNLSLATGCAGGGMGGGTPAAAGVLVWLTSANAESDFHSFVPSA